MKASAVQAPTHWPAPAESLPGQVNPPQGTGSRRVNVAKPRGECPHGLPPLVLVLPTSGRRDGRTMRRCQQTVKPEPMCGKQTYNLGSRAMLSISLTRAR